MSLFFQSVREISDVVASPPPLRTHTQELEPQDRSGSYPAASPLATPTQRRHPALGCQVFHSPGRARAVRACGWGGRSKRVDGGGGGVTGGFASNSKRLREVRSLEVAGPVRAGLLVFFVFRDLSFISGRASAEKVAKILWNRSVAGCENEKGEGRVYQTLSLSTSSASPPPPRPTPRNMLMVR